MLVISGPTADAAVIGPGSGVATMSPDTAIVAIPGTWSVVYDAEDNFTNGTIRDTIPAGWTAPQDTDPSAPGYGTVSSDHGAARPTLAIAGRVVTITVVDLPKKSVTLVYGDDSGGAQPGARAVPPTTAASGVEFAVESDPTGTLAVPLLLGPATLDLMGGAITELVFDSEPFSFHAASYGGPYIVQARDTYGNASLSPTDQQINLATDSPEGTFSPSSGGSPSVGNLTMPAGASSVMFYYRDTQPGTPTIAAAADGQLWTAAVQQQQVAAGPPDHFGLTPQDTTVTAGEFMRFKIRVEDLADNSTALTETRTLLLSSSVTAAGPQPAPEQGSGEFFLPGDHSTPITQMSMSAGEESVYVDYRNTDANEGSAHLVIVLSNNASPTLSGDTNVYVDPAGVSASVSTVTAQSPVTANGVNQSLVTVTVTDGFGNPVHDASVSLTIGGDAVPPSASGSTNTEGLFQVGVTNTTAEVLTVSATADGTPLDDTPQIAFVAGPVDAGTSQVDATSPVEADGVATSTITVAASDALGNPVPGATVVLSVDPTGAPGDLIQPGGVTDSNGQAQGTLRSSTVGTRVVTALINGSVNVSDDATIEFVAGDPSEFVWSHDGVAIAGLSEPVTLEVLDDQGHRVKSYTENVRVWTTKTGGTEEWIPGTGAHGTVSQVGGEWYYQFGADDSGYVELRLTVSKAESITLGAEQGSVTGSSSTLVVAAAAADTLLIVSGNNQTAVVNTAVANDLVVRVVDAFGNNVSGEDVTFTVTEGGGSLDLVSGPPVESVGASGPDGRVSCEEWILGTGTGENTVKAQMTSGSVVEVWFTATAVPGQAESIVIEPGSGSITAGSSRSVTATLLDGLSNPIDGETVTILIGDSDVADGTLANDPAHPTTGLNPTARQGTTDDALGAGLTRDDVDDVVYTTVSQGATKFKIVFVGSSTARAGDPFEFEVRAVDDLDNVVTGYAGVASLTPSGGGIEFSETSDFSTTVTQVTLTSGVATAFGRGENVGSWTITADDGAGGLTAGVADVIIINAAAIDHYYVTRGPSATVQAGDPFTITVEARDRYENIVLEANNGVDLTAVDAGSLTPTGHPLFAPTATLVNGRVSLPESYNYADTIRVSVQGGGPEGLSEQIRVTARPAYQIVKISGNGWSVPVNTGVSLVAQVQDEFGNPVEGEDVFFAATLGGGSVNPASQTSGQDGKVTTTFTTGPAAGTDQVTARIDDGDPSRELVTFTGTTVAGGIAYYTVGPANTNPTAGDAVLVTIQAFDSEHNPVTSDNSTEVVITTTTADGQ
ncbi:MAG: Ig-like domain-containing protein, partial [bacterium]